MDIGNENDSALSEISQLDMGVWSILHYFFTRQPVQKVTFIKSYLMPWAITAFLFYGFPLVVALVKAPNIIIHDPRSSLKVGFLDDWNIMFMYLVTLPMFVILMLSERSMVPNRIAAIIRARGNSLNKPMGAFVSSWNKRYKMINILGQLAGAIVAFAVALANYKTALLEDFNGWEVTQGTVNAAGWVYLCWQIPLFYWITSVYIIQGMATITLLFSFTRNFEIRVSPFHHDNCCGLRTVGQIGLRNQYLLAVAGLNLLALLVVNISRGDARTVPLLVAGIVSYVIFGPLVFIGPLLPFRKAMLSAKEIEQEKVAIKLQQEYNRIMDALERRSMTKEDEEVIERLQKLKVLVNRIPVWPFDISTLRRFFTVYILPFLTALVSLLLNYLLKTFGALFAA